MAILLGAAAATGQSDNHPRLTIQPVEGGPNPWTHLRINDDPERFQFAIVSDRTGGARPGIFEDAVTKLNLLQPEFVMSVGDLIQGGITDTGEIDRQWDEFDGFVQELNMPFFYVPGNHDISNDVMAQAWKRRHGRPYYHFLYRDVLFLCLNSEDPKSHIGEEQIEYFRQVLREHTEVRWTLAFLHRPLWTEEEDNGWKGIEDLLAHRKHTVIAGHWHTYAKFDRLETDYIVLATSGGGSGMRGPLFGEFDHVVWVTMTEEGPLLANLMLEGIWDKNIRTEEMARVVYEAMAGRTVSGGSQLLPGADVLLFESQLRIENTADVPMHFTATTRPHPNWEPKQTELKLTVPPNSIESVPLAVSRKNQGSLLAPSPLWIDWQVTFEYPRHSDSEIAGSYPLILEVPLPLPSAPSGLEVDGSLGEWTEMPVLCKDPAQVERQQSWTGVEDASFRFGAVSTENGLVVGIQAIDDEVVPVGDRELSDSDGFGIFVETRGEDGKLLTHQVDIGWNGSYEVPQGEEPGALSVAALKTEAGYDLEVLLPSQWLAESYQQVRLNVRMRDRDGSGRTATLWWRPEWNTRAAFPESGMFIKN
jgi:hypothetical protein